MGFAARDVSKFTRQMDGAPSIMASRLPRLIGGKGAFYPPHLRVPCENRTLFRRHALCRRLSTGSAESSYEKWSRTVALRRGTPSASPNLSMDETALYSRREYRSR